eukprot:Skav224775  [mRNA]  locus=scaffold933:277339:278319:+ [translate_table: standard]
MEVCSVVSGEHLAFCNAEDIEGKSFKEVKQLLAAQIGVPRFRQRLFLENGLVEISDDQILAPGTRKVWLVLLEFERTVGEPDQDMISACQDNDAVALERLLQRPCSPNLKERQEGSTALHHAARNGHIQPVQLLLQASADANQATDGGASPLLLAARHGHVEIVRLLLEAGANANQATTNRSTSPLFLAASEGHLESARLLIEAGADKNHADSRCGASPLWVAAGKGQVEMVRLLLEAGAIANQATTNTGTSPLILAASEGHLEIVRLLLAAGADKNQATTDDGTSPYQIATQNGHLEIAGLLRSRKRSRPREIESQEKMIPLEGW